MTPPMTILEELRAGARGDCVPERRQELLDVAAAEIERLQGVIRDQTGAVPIPRFKVVVTDQWKGETLLHAETREIAIHDTEGRKTIELAMGDGAL